MRASPFEYDLFIDTAHLFRPQLPGVCVRELPAIFADCFAKPGRATEPADCRSQTGYSLRRIRNWNFQGGVFGHKGADTLVIERHYRYAVRHCLENNSTE